MIYFGIPLRSKKASKDWDKVTAVFNRTLQSVYRQTCPEFRIYVACHEIPPLKEQYDERVEFLIADTPTPRNGREMMLDKGWKISMIAQKIRAAGGGYTMLVDADDLVSNRIAEYAKENPDLNGFTSRTGYLYTEGDDFCRKIHMPYRICGSCTIVKYTPKDLPSIMPEDFYDDSSSEQWLIRKPHRAIPDELSNLGRPLSFVSFPMTVYVRGTGDNHSMLGGGHLSSKRQLELMLSRKIPLSSISEEFGC